LPKPPTPRFASLFGDIFLEGDDRAWWFLDTFEGELRREWDDRDAMVAVLETEKGQDRYLMAGLALGAYQRRGLRLGPAQIYAWAPPRWSPAASRPTTSGCSPSS
jgi:hypothetical protein